MTFSPKLNILPASQRALWKELKATPKHFVLYGGTALALRLGHRISEDFDFFTNANFEPQELAEQILYLRDGNVTLLRENTLTVVPDRTVTHLDAMSARRRYAALNLPTIDHLFLTTLATTAETSPTVNTRVLA